MNEESLRLLLTLNTGIYLYSCCWEGDHLDVVAEPVSPFSIPRGDMLTEQ